MSLCWKFIEEWTRIQSKILFFFKFACAVKISLTFSYLSVFLRGNSLNGRIENILGYSSVFQNIAPHSHYWWKCPANSVDCQHWHCHSVRYFHQYWEYGAMSRNAEEYPGIFLYWSNMVNTVNSVNFALGICVFRNICLGFELSFRRSFHVRHLCGYIALIDLLSQRGCARRFSRIDERGVVPSYENHWRWDVEFYGSLVWSLARGPEQSREILGVFYNISPIK